MEDMFFYNIDKYVYEECSESEMKLFMEHLKSCEKCKAEYELACQVKAAMHSMNNITPPADFSKLVNDRLDREISKPKSRTFIKAGYRKYSAVAACLVLAAVLGAEKVNFTDAPVLDSSIVTNESLLPVAQTGEIENGEISPVISEAVSGGASTIYSPTAEPAKTVSPARAQKTPAPQKTPAATKMPVIPDHLNPEKQTVLASSVEKTYEISGVGLEDIPVKKRCLEEEFALLETTKTGVIVANPATLSSLEGIEVKVKKSNSADYGVGSGSIFIDAKDKEIVDKLITKYISIEDNSCYFFTGDNFNSFINELEEQGINYKENLIFEKGSNVAIKVLLA